MTEKFNPIDEVRVAGQATVGTLISSAARAHADSIAISDKETQLKYAAFDARTNQAARFLEAHGVSHGDRVAILASNCIEYMLLMVGCAKLGAIAACQNWRLGSRELQHCIDLVSPNLIFFNQETRDSLDSISVGGLPTIDLIEYFRQRLDEYSDAPVAASVHPEDPLLIIYTSGTTGLPKGAIISHRAMIARAQILHADLALPKQDHYMAWAPMFHMISTDQSIGMLTRGSRVHVVNGYDVDEMVRLIETYPMGLLPLVPGMVGAFVTELEKRGVQPQKMNYIGAMADLIPRAEIEQATKFFDAPYFNTFGATETGIGPASAGAIPPGPVPDRLLKKQNAFYDVRLVDAEDNEVPVGTPGEVSITGPALFSGYWNNDEANRKDFRGGRFHMGDVLRRDTNGMLEYVDRVKYMIKSGGENIYPAEIELVLCRDERVETAIVVRKPDDKWGEIPVAFIVRRDDAVTEEDLRAACQADLSRYKHPKAYYFVPDEEIPRSTTGKIQRHILEKLIPA